MRLWFLFQILLALMVSQSVSAEPEQPVNWPVLGAEQLALLEEIEALEVGVRSGQPPLAFTTAEDRLAGTYVDYLTLIAARLRVGLDVVPLSADGDIPAWSESDPAIRVSARRPNAPVPEGWLRSQPLMELTYGIFSDPGDAGIRKLGDLERRRVALVGKDTNQFALLDSVNSFTPVPVTSVSEAVSMVLSGRADAFIGPVPVVVDYLQSALINGVALVALLDQDPVDLVLEVRQEREVLLPILNEAIASITHTDHRRIRSSWLPEAVVETETSDGLTLSVIEQEWLRQNGPLRVAYRENWPPFEFTENGSDRGLVPDLVQRMGENLGTRLERRTVSDWTEAERMLRNGEIDLLPALPRTPRREEDFLFTRTYLTLPIVVVIREDGRFIGDLRELREERVGVVSQHAAHDYLLINHPELNIYPVNTVQDGLLALSNGDLEVMVTHIPGVSYTVAELGLSNLRITSITPYEYEFRMAVNRNRGELVRILNKGLGNINTAEKDEIYNRWVYLDLAQDEDYTAIKRVVLIAVVVVLIFLYWNRKLSREVDERIRSEHALRRSEDELRAAKLEAERLAREAEGANRAKSEFLANMSHEIRTPMNAVIGYSDLLSKTVSDPQQKHYLDAIRASSRSLLMLINDILDLSRIEAGKMRLEFGPVSLRRMLQDVRHIFDLRAREHSVSLEVSVESDMPAGMVLDETRLRQVLFNLVGNAIKFTHEGGVTVRASVAELRQEGEQELCNLSIAVSDTGIGIAEDQQERIFDAFEQQEGQSSRKYGGTGLGLAISRKLARMMGGELMVKSREGHGSTFTVLLPGVAVVPMEDEPEEQPELSQTPMTETLDMQERSWLKEQLREDFGDDWHTVRESGDPEQMRYFAAQVLSWGQRYRSRAVTRYAEKLMADVDAFNLDAINHALEAFPDLLGSEPTSNR
ncbi:transporter substrate-binding domain-containing protein [Marinobacter bryozoorum]|uniref:ATP-binding protein n=1 Tax=Marinobacter bryozoorum TaxID=256324 RepID=UPI0020032EFA|nr:transporter substrate-binding domain-containing protein [Marinobacter bryozoorum]MCK7544529.1 transporter substrate-binding domain-containing protein [Marinobacter bryozoorum]